MNYKPLPMAKLDFTLIGIAARYILFSIIKVRYKIFSCVIYKGACACGTNYFGETIRNIKTRWNKDESGIDKNLKCF